MPGCCSGKSKDLESTAQNHRKVLWTVLVINAIMFFAESFYGWIAHSLALTGDSLDMLGDAVTYGVSIAVIGMTIEKIAAVAKLKAWMMLIFGLLISAQCLYRVAYPVLPGFATMLIVGSIALAANLVCLYLLTSYKDDDINMRSVWICSRNDIIANSSVLLAGVVVYYTGSAIPDIVVGVALAFLFTKSAMGLFKEIEQSLEAS